MPLQRQHSALAFLPGIVHQLIPHETFLLFLGISAALPFALFASDSLPFPVSLGGQTAKEGTPFARIDNPVAADAELSVESKSGMIIVNVNAVNAQQEPVPGSTPAVILLQGKTKTNIDKTMDGKKLRCRKLSHERGKRRQNCQYPLHHQVVFAARSDSFFASDPNFAFSSFRAGPARIRTWDQGIMSPLL